MKKIALLSLFLLSSVCLASAASANFIVDPAKLGILRLQLYPLSPAVAIREFQVGNTYNVSMNVEVEAVDGLEGIVTISDANFTLAPGEFKTVQYTVTVSEPGYYTGGVLIRAGAEGMSSIGYNSELSIFVNRSNLQPYIYAAIIAVIAVVAAAFAIFLRKGASAKRKRKR